MTTGLSYRTGTQERPSPAMVLAMTAGVAIPLGILLLIFTGLPGEVWLVAIVGVCVVILFAVRRARSARLRASVRAARHASAKAAAAPDSPADGSPGIGAEP